jgi:protoporphyrinogen/coproporphyrinogen III oxidase
VRRASVVIVGGGISGLSAAWELSGGASGPSESSPRIEVLESSERFGGVLKTTTFANRTVDLGADGFLARRPEAVTLAKELGLESQLEAIGASGAFLWLRGALHPLPTGLVLGVPTSRHQVQSVKGLSFKAKLQSLRDELLPRRLDVSDDATIGHIVRTKLGRELSYQFIEPMIGGIQAGRIDELSAKSVFPALLDAARKGGSLMKALRPTQSAVPGPRSEASSEGPAFYSLLNGVGSLTDELEKQLSQRGVVFRKSTPVTALRRTPAGDYAWEVDTATTTTPADYVIVATPAHITAQLVGSQHKDLKALESVTTAGAAMVTLHFSEEDIALTPTGTGVLVPLQTPWTGEGSLMITALTFLDRKWPHLKQPGSVVLRAHVGRSDDARWLSFSDDELAQRVTKELAFLLKMNGAPLDTLVQRWPSGLPQYRLGHEQLVANAKAAASELRLALCGNAYDGVGIPASVGSGRRAAREVLSSLGN